uniref:Cation/H+ exchanger transmembrane domain-containing protein n=1 Tax=Fagus sylvatica TaxID=28930 RepID=A0A2N9J2D2_FAGSY
MSVTVLSEFPAENLDPGSIQLFKKLDIATLVIGDYLALGAIFSATDSVCTLQVLKQEETPLLYSLVFGEGVLNDATSVHNAGGSSESLSPFVCTGLFVHMHVGLLCAYIIKKLYFGSHSTDREVALMMLMAYLSYITAESYDVKTCIPAVLFNGILTVFFCGIVMSHYTWHNVTESSRVTTKHAFATLSFVSEIFIFLYVGMDAFDMEKWTVVSNSPGTSIGVSSMLLALVLIGRAAFVFPLSFISNLTKKSLSDKIGFKQQVTIWWAGLMRGAVSVALAYNQFTRSGHTQLRGNAIMITSTITVVLFTTMLGGLLMKSIVRLLLPQQKHSGSLMSTELSSPKSLILPLLDMGANNIRRPTSLRMLLTTPSHTVHHYWWKFDDAFMRPVFGGRGFVPYAPGSTEGIVQ